MRARRLSVFKFKLDTKSKILKMTNEKNKTESFEPLCLICIFRQKRLATSVVYLVLCDCLVLHKSSNVFVEMLKTFLYNL